MRAVGLLLKPFKDPFIREDAMNNGLQSESRQKFLRKAR